MDAGGASILLQAGPGDWVTLARRSPTVKSPGAVTPAYGSGVAEVGLLGEEGTASPRRRRVVKGRRSLAFTSRANVLPVRRRISA